MAHPAWNNIAPENARRYWMECHHSSRMTRFFTNQSYTNLDTCVKNRLFNVQLYDPSQGVG